MRIFKYLFSVWTGILVYTIFTFFCGPKGISSYNYLLAERESQRENINSLMIINEELNRNRNNLLYDQDTLMVHARHIGYGYEDERFVRIVGLSAFPHTGFNYNITGDIYTAQKPENIPDKSIKIAALCAGFMMFAFLFMLEIIEKRVNSF